MIVDEPRNSIFGRPGGPSFPRPAHSEAGIGRLPVFREIEAVFDQKRTREGIVAHAVSANPRVTERKAHNEQNDEQDFVFRKATQSCSASSTGAQTGLCGEASWLQPSRSQCRRIWRIPRRRPRLLA